MCDAIKWGTIFVFIATKRRFDAIASADARAPARHSALCISYQTRKWILFTLYAATAADEVNVASDLRSIKAESGLMHPAALHRQLESKLTLHNIVA